MKKSLPLFNRNYWVYLISLAFILLNSLFISRGYYYLLALPLALFIAYLAFVSIDKLFYILVFFVPISIPLQVYMPGLGFNVQIPTDPLLVLIFIVLLIKIIYEKKFDKRILLHPISIVIYVYLTWIFITALTSTMPLISFKFLISRIWFITTFYFLATQFFAVRTGIRRFIWTYLPLMLAIIIIVIVHMTQYGLFNQQAAHLASYPFFNDHTAFGATLAMLLPFVIGLALLRKYSIPLRFLAWIFVCMITFALILSYCRAAWISILVAAGVSLILVLRIKFRIVFVLMLIGMTFFLTHRTELFLNLEQNTQNSSKDFSKHIQSMTNIETDVSNLERINRWKSAMRMFKERPVFGWGPGTYMFNYAPFQMSYDRTEISTNMGDRGNAHSDYIGSLAESGIFGCVSFLLLLIVTLYKGFTLYSKVYHKPQIRILVACAILGLITYFTHATLNNFLDTDKVSSLFWGYAAMIVAIDVYQTEGEEESFKKSESPA